MLTVIFETSKTTIHFDNVDPGVTVTEQLPHVDRVQLFHIAFVTN